MGSTRALTDSAGNISDSYNYEAFGQLLNQAGTTENDYLFTGEQYDSGLDQYYLRARYYDPSSGRFTQQDTWMGNNSDPITLHKYLYGNADPGNMVDPSGQFGLMSFGVANNIRGILSEIQVNVGFSVLDIALDPGNAASNAGTNMFLGLATMGGAAAFKMLRLLSGKFRKACNSFEGETLVSTEHGLKPISEIKIGEKVWAYDEKTGEKSLQEVVHLIQGEGEKEIIDITLETGEVIRATSGHPFYVKEDVWDWVDAGQLDVGDILREAKGGTVAVASIKGALVKASVYNLTVDNAHTYFVGEEGVLSHNAQKECKFDGLIIGAKKPQQFRHPKHNGGPGRKPGEVASIEPDDSEYVFKRLSVKAENGNWYGKAPDGRIYRYAEDQGELHWNGSTGNTKGSIRAADIPKAVKKAFDFKSKGKY